MIGPFENLTSLIFGFPVSSSTVQGKVNFNSPSKPLPAEGTEEHVMFLHALLQHGLVSLVQQDPWVTPARVVIVRKDVLLAVVPLLVVVVRGVVVVMDVMVGDGAPVVSVVLHGVGGSLVPG